VDVNVVLAETLFKCGFTFLLAFALALYLVPRLRDAAIRMNIVDTPDGKLKNHRQPVPYLGGLGVYLAFLVALAVTFDFDREVLGLILAGTIVLLLGLIDDFRALTPGVKFIGQILAAGVLIKSGIYIKLVFLPLWATIPLTILWVVAVTNAFNIIDIMDGLSGGVAFCASIPLVVVAIVNGRLMIAIVTLALAGALLGFLRFNFHPSQIYLGDTGSMFIGLMMASLAMLGSYTGSNVLAALGPGIILGVPLFDMLFVMYVRWRRGVPVVLGSPDHFALRLRKWRLSTTQTVLVSYLVTLVFGAVALGMMLLPLEPAAVLLGCLVLVVLAAALALKQIDMKL
jgi:UDP-GlcNAc:undecaprenyl-phosphate GlcNAc-1-phosphate transferase